MSQRDSGHARRPYDSYATPAWVTEALLPHLPLNKDDWVWEPAAGSGKMVRALRKAGYKVLSSDITRGRDFLNKKSNSAVAAIITNPPYSHAQQFIETALDLTQGHRGLVAMLLRVDYDSAKTRRHLFADHPAFWKKIVLTKRIKWIEDSTGSPSENHAWFIWGWGYTSRKDLPTIWYAP